MRTLVFLLQKEFRQIFRNKSLLPMIFIMPVVQLLIMPLAADYEVKNINIAIVDHDHSGLSKRLSRKIASSGYFRISDYGESYGKAFSGIERDVSDLILEIPRGFEEKLTGEKKEKVLIAVNAINGVKANLGGVYLTNILAGFNEELRRELLPGMEQLQMAKISITSTNRFNPNLNYQFFMVPGILVSLVTMVGVYLCSLNIVKEKEVGTIEQINVTPIRKIHFILGKMIPFWFIGMLVYSIGLFAVARLAYGIVPQGSLLLLYSYLAIYLVAVLGVGLLISTYSETQQQAMSLAFFILMIFILMSGLFTSVDSMPGWAQVISRLNPMTYFIEVMRMVVLKGSGFMQIKTHFVVMLGFAVFFNGWAVINYKKTR